MTRILLACGIGASTGFMAANMRKAAKAQGLDVSIHAVSKSQVPEYADKIDVLLLGPHFSAEVPKYKEMLKDHNVKVTSIDPDDYAALDGEAILESALEFYEASWQMRSCSLFRSRWSVPSRPCGPSSAALFRCCRTSAR